MTTDRAVGWNINSYRELNMHELQLVHRELVQEVLSTAEYFINHSFDYFPFFQ
jgi:hypothetical protein